MSHSYITGTGGSITFASATLDVESWSLNVNGPDVDVTNTGSGGWDEIILGSKNFEGSLKAFWDSGAVPTGTVGFVAGARATITLPVGNTGKNYTGSVQLTQIAIENPVKSAVTFNVNFKGNGQLTYAS